MFPYHHTRIVDALDELVLELDRGRCILTPWGLDPSANPAITRSTSVCDAASSVAIVHLFRCFPPVRDAILLTLLLTWRFP